MNKEHIFCYVTNESCLLKTAAPDDESFGHPVSECGDYDAWTLNQEETNALALSGSGYRRRAARAVQEEMAWQVNLCPIRERLTMELTRILHRDNQTSSATDVIAWMDANVDEDNIARRNGFQPVAIAEDLAKCYSAEQEVTA